MRNVLVFLAFVVIASSAMASSIAEYPMVSLGIQQSNATAGLNSASALYYGGAVEFPVNGYSSLKAGIALGNNYGVSSTIIDLTYKFEIK